MDLALFIGDFLEVFQNFYRWLRSKLKAYQRLQLGRKGEDAATSFLKKKGYFIWKRNWRCRQGELDIIAYNDRCLRIIEVKSRQKQHQGDFPAIEAITAEKIERMDKLARIFMRRNSKQMRIRGLNSFCCEGIVVLFAKTWLNSKEIIYYQNLSDSFDFSNLNGN
jgi:putative endonuclease